MEVFELQVFQARTAVRYLKKRMSFVFAFHMYMVGQKRPFFKS